MIIIGDIHTQNNYSRRVLYLALIACCNQSCFAGPQIHREASSPDRDWVQDHEDICQALSSPLNEVD